MLEAYEHHPDAFTSSLAERAALPFAWWESRLKVDALPAELVLGGFRDGTLGGATGLSFEPREKARHKAHLFGMYVLPRFRQAGLGRQLVRAALEYAKAREGVKLVQLTVTHGNAAALSVYERCGFVPYGLEPYAVAVGPHYVAKVHMWRNLGVGDDSVSNVA